MKIKVGGVPEYFNLPFRLAIENGDFEKVGLDVEWTDYLQGTGKLAADLASGSLDLAVLLTEGAIKAIYEGNPSKIIKTHVNSPLIWGIFVPAGSAAGSIAKALHGVIAISRYGSGSHLMAIHLALQMSIPVDSLNFLVVDDLNGAREAFKNGKADVFFWEKYTTKPFVDSSEFDCIGEHPTPWPAFVIVASDRMITQHNDQVQDFLRVVNQSVKDTRRQANLPAMISRRYGLKNDDLPALLTDLKWSTESDLPDAFEEEILMTFQTANILGEEKRAELFFR